MQGATTHPGGVMFYLGHPAHFHLFRETIRALRAGGHACEILIKRKDVLERLLDREGWSYRNVMTGERGNGKLRIAWGLLKRDREVLRIVRARRPRLLVGTSAEIAHAGRLAGVPSVVVNEDDHDVVPLFAWLAYPFADAVLAPDVCRLGRWRGKGVFYAGYHELAYLHPERFRPDEAVAARLRGEAARYFVLRLAALTAHHDGGKRGIEDDLADRLIALLEPHGAVYISAERGLAPRFESYRYPLPPDTMHHALAGAALYVGDSQTMAAEAAVLGTPSVRFNDFVGEIGYLEELEHRYELTYGIPTSAPERLLAKIDELLAKPDLAAVWARRRDRMLREKIDVTAFLVWLIEAYPESVAAMQADPDVQDRFRLQPAP